MRRSILHSASVLSLIVLTAPGRAEPGDWDDPSWQVLRQAHVRRDAHSLAEYLRGLCGDGADVGRIDALARQLGAPEFDEREAAQKALTAAGPAALATLRPLRADADAEVARRAGECVTAIEAKWDPEKALAAVRVLVRRGGDEAVPALLRFLPCADAEEMRDAVWFGLDALTVRAGKVDASLADALHDGAAARRAAAACVVGRRGDAEQRAAVRKLLDDADPEVRLRAAQGLLAARDAAGLPTLTALLEGTPLETAWQAEELLRYVAGPEAPQAVLGRGAAEERRACRAAWEAWRKGRGVEVDFAGLDATSRRPGLTLLVDGGAPEGPAGRVWLLGCDGVTRWEMRDLSEPTDARLGGGRVLIAQRGKAPPVTVPLAPPPRRGGSVGAFGYDGAMLWQYRGVDDPTMCLPLSDGHIVVTGRELCIAEVDTLGRETTHADFRAGQFPNLYISMPPNSRVVARRLDQASGTYQWQEVEPDSPFYCKTEVVPWFACYRLSSDRLWQVEDDNRLVVDERAQRIMCFDKDAWRHWNPWTWKLIMPGVADAVKLPTGSVLAGGVGRVLEMDGRGIVVWSASFEDQAQRIRPCLNRVRLGFDAPRTTQAQATSPATWLHGLSSKDAAVRRRTAAAVGGLWVHGVEAGPALVPLLHDPDPSVRDAAGCALAEVYPVVTPEARKTLHSKDPAVRHNWQVYFYLAPRSPERTEAEARNGSLHDDVFAFHKSLLKEDDPELRVEGASDLGAEEEHPQEALSALMEATHDSSAKVRQYAVTGIGRFAGEAKAAIPLLLTCLKDESMEVRWQAASALSEIDPADIRVFPVLVEVIQAKRPNDNVVCALGQCRARAKEIVAVMKDLLESRCLRGADSSSFSDDFGDRLLWSLGVMGAEAKSAIPTLSRILQRKEINPRLRLEAAQALARIDSTDQETTSAIEKARRVGLLEDRAARILLAEINND